MTGRDSATPDINYPMLGHHMLNLLAPVVGALKLVRSGQVGPGDLSDLLDRAQGKLHRLTEAARLLANGHPEFALTTLAGTGDEGFARET